MLIVEKVFSLKEMTDFLETFIQDTLTLTWEDRRESHGKRVSDNGVAFALSLPSGTALKKDDCLLLEPLKTIIRIQETKEAVYIINPETSQEWAYFAFQIGNRHQPVMIGETELICLQDPAVKSLFEQLKVPYTSDIRPFTPAIMVGGHSH